MVDSDEREAIVVDEALVGLAELAGVLPSVQHLNVSVCVPHVCLVVAFFLLVRSSCVS